MRRSNIELVERDLKIFEVIKRVGWIRQDNIAYLLGVDYKSLKINHLIRSISYRLQKHGYIIKKKFIAGAPNYWCFSKLGAELNDSIAEPKFILQNAKHDDLVARLLIDHLHLGVDNIKTEFELKRQAINKALKIPDLIIDETTAIEIEISLKSSARINAIIKQYKFSKYKQVIYYTTEKIATTMLSRAICDDKFIFKIINEDDILNSPVYIHNKADMNHQDDSRQKIREMFGI